MPRKSKTQSDRPTLVDVAREAGVSAITVSRTIRSPEIVSERARRKVEEAVRKQRPRDGRGRERLHREHRERHIFSKEPDAKAVDLGGTRDLFDTRDGILDPALQLASTIFFLVTQTIRRMPWLGVADRYSSA